MVRHAFVSLTKGLPKQTRLWIQIRSKEIGFNSVSENTNITPLTPSCNITCSFFRQEKMTLNNLTKHLHQYKTKKNLTFIIGVINPPSVATATDTSMVGDCSAAPLCHTVLASGTCRKVCATALMIKSFTDNFKPSAMKLNCFSEVVSQQKLAEILLKGYSN